jgi:hypothetical protein
MSGESIFNPKPVARVQDAVGTSGPDKIYDYIIGDDDNAPKVRSAEKPVEKVPEKVEKPKSEHGELEIKLNKSSFKTGQSINGTLEVKLKKPLEGESLAIGVWGQKSLNLPVDLHNNEKGKSRVYYVSQRSQLLSEKKKFDKEETYEFKLPVIAPVPDIAIEYRWFVGASLTVNEDEEITDMVEIKVSE